MNGKRLWVQEYGEQNRVLLDGLNSRGAQVRTVPIYAWILPEDTGPLEQAVRELCEGAADAAHRKNKLRFSHHRY